MSAPLSLRARLARAGGGDIGEPRPEFFFTAASKTRIARVERLDLGGPGIQPTYPHTDIVVAAGAASAGADHGGAKLKMKIFQIFTPDEVQKILAAEVIRRRGLVFSGNPQTVRTDLAMLVTMQGGRMLQLRLEVNVDAVGR